MENKTVALSRQLAMIAYIERHPGIQASELAKHFGRTSRQIKRDIDLIDRAGFGDLLPDKTFALDMDRYLEHEELVIDRDLSVNLPRLTPQEAAYLVMGLAAIGPTLDDGDAAMVPTLIANLLAISGSESSDLVGENAVSQVRVFESNLPTRTWRFVRRAIQSNRQLKIGYLSSPRTDASVESNQANSEQQLSRHTTRLIDPLNLWRVEDGWLVRAWCHQAEGIRSFRLDRMTSCSLTDAEQNHPHLVEENDVAPPDLFCMVRLKIHAQWLLNELPAVQVEIDDDSLNAKFEVWDENWMVSRLLELADDVVETDPPTFKEMTQDRAQQAADVWMSFAHLEETC